MTTRGCSIARLETVWRSIRGTVVALAFAVACGPVFAQVGYAGRATESDYAQLARDVARLGVAEREFNLRRDSGAQLLALERQKQLLAVDEGGNLVLTEGAADLRKWWVDHVLQPALDVAANPAASCTISQHVIQRLIELSKQAQRLGSENEELGRFGDNETFTRAIKIANQRCMEEAFDECMETGNGQALYDLLLQWERQLQILDWELDDKEWQERLAYLFRRCTVYRFIYHLDLEGVQARTSAAADGTFTLLFEFGEAGRGLMGVVNGLWTAPRPQDAESPDLLLSSLNCGPRTVSCEIEKSPMGGYLYGTIRIKHYVRKQTLVIDTERPEDLVFGGRLVIRTERVEEGDDKIGLAFSPPLVETQGRYNPPGEIYTFPGDAPSTLMYFEAYGGVSPQITEWRRQGYPVLFTAASSASNGTSSVRGNYQLVHRPDLFPPEEIIPRFEIVRSEVPEPPRVPLRPPQ